MKKVLIITYYWPPAGGPGVQRWLKFVKYLRDFDVEPVVYVPENPHYPIQDASLAQEIPKGVEVIKRRIFEPYSFAKIFSNKDTQKISSGIIPEGRKQGLRQKAMLYIRGNFFIPDARKFWIKPSVKFLTDYLSENEIKTIITTGPPHSLHLIGLELKEHTGLKWIADFRDPWTAIGYHKQLKLTKTSRKLHKNLERKVLKEADRIITTSFATKKEFSKKTTTPISVITNGYDIEKRPIPALDDKFSISHIGSLLSARNPKLLWEAIGELKVENPGFAKNFQLKLYGTVGEEVVNSINQVGIGEELEVGGYLPHWEAVKLQRSSQMLLLIEANRKETQAIIPGKLFEYLVSNRPILAVGPEKADFSTIISETKTGEFFTYSEKDKMKAYILKNYAAFLDKNLKVVPVGIEKYSRRSLTEQLAKLT